MNCLLLNRIFFFLTKVTIVRSLDVVLVRLNPWEMHERDPLARSIDLLSYCSKNKIARAMLRLLDCLFWLNFWIFVEATAHALKAQCE